MIGMDEGMTVAVSLDARQFRSELSELDRLTRGFERLITRAFVNAAREGDRLSDVMRKLVLSLSEQTVAAALRPLSQGIAQGMTSLMGGLFANARGNVISSGTIRPFADGGIVNGPTLFPMRGGIGLMGEAGPEAILPLARGSDGRLGVRSHGGEGAGRPIQITVNVSTPDLQGFRQAQGEIGAALARAVARGQRHL